MNFVDDVTQQKAQLLDVRDKHEWRKGHAKGAIHISVNRLLSGDTGSLDPDRPVYIYCASGNRAGTAQYFLKRQGYEAVNIGGLGNWARAGGAVVR